MPPNEENNSLDINKIISYLEPYILEFNSINSRANFKDIYTTEHEILKDDLFHLKDCQIKFIAFAVTSTGLLLSFIAKEDPSSIFYLIPLIILLPAWCVFSDKAVTLTRILGYYTILEGLLVDRYTVSRFLGWERALGEFRTNYEKKYRPLIEASFEPWNKLSLLDRSRFFLQVILIRRKAKPNYWHLVYSIFFWLSCICILLSLWSLLKSSEHWKVYLEAYIASILLVICFIYIILGVYRILLVISLILLIIFIHTYLFNYSVLDYLFQTVNSNYSQINWSLALIAVISIITIYICRENIVTLHELERGIYSCKANNLIWKNILDVKRIPDIF